MKLIHRLRAIGLAAIVGLSILATPATVLSARVYAAGPDACYNRAGFLNMPTWYEYLDLGAREKKDSQGVVVSVDPCAIVGPADPATNSFSFQRALPRIALAIIEIMLRVAGIVAVVFVMIGGFKYMTSQGEPDALKQAQGSIINALIGLAISILSVTIVSFVGRTIWN